ncbi:hypothetical protein TNIN_167381, partial [Trichonephila inaurata madagascariensis]
MKVMSRKNNPAYLRDNLTRFRKGSSGSPL